MDRIALIRAAALRRTSAAARAPRVAAPPPTPPPARTQPAKAPKRTRRGRHSSAEYQSAWRKARAAKGLCRWCPNRGAPLCPTCKAAHAARQLERYRAATAGRPKLRLTTCTVCRMPGHDRRTCPARAPAIEAA